MRKIRFILEKEFRQIFRNKGMLPIIFVMPIVQLLILANAATFDIKNIKIIILDQDHSTFSKRLVSNVNASPYFALQEPSANTEQAEDALKEEKSDMYVVIPADFEKDLMKEQNAEVQMIINAIDGSKAGLASAYFANLLANFNIEMASSYGLKTNAMLTSNNSSKSIAVANSNWYNQFLNYKFYMVPGILVLLVTMIGAFLSSMNIVREKEIGTIEQLNVTPIKNYEFIIGKLLPFWLIGLFELALGLTLAKIFYNIPIEGSLLIIFVFAGIYLLAVLGMGLLISTITETQQQSMFISWFFLVIFILLSGLFTAIENMPEWAQKITLFNPVRYFIEVTRMVMLKGAGFSAVKTQFVVMLAFAFCLNLLAILRYRKTAS
ncbi:ABC transporter permease [Chondrinema litorale]|uniref:ABC transporter permease n=1 Tax=Chondrinema litorale TaxID=2994555 RepID=UPI0025433B09|nr:ABC transporter permease [Chondrinema litorale]UZR93710.1 ABC transporter permease [Chondrinema litorale]